MIGIVLQARMGSTRLPGKMLMEMVGHSMLWHNIQRLRRVERADVLVVAVPEGAADRPLVDQCQREGWEVFCGSEKDVLARYYHCAREFGFAHVVRATGDCPLVDPEVVDGMIAMHLAEGADYSSSKDEVGCRVPKGAGLEMFSFAALARSYREGSAANHREHINEFIIEYPEAFRIAAYREPAAKRCQALELTVDTKEDFLFVKSIIEAFDGDHDAMTTEAVIAHCAAAETKS